MVFRLFETRYIAFCGTSKDAGAKPGEALSRDQGAIWSQFSQPPCSTSQASRP